MNDKPEITKEAIDADMSFNAPIEQQEATVPVIAPTVADINAMSPIMQMQQAKSMGLSVAEMKEMLAIQKEWEENEARKAFHAALSEWKKNPPKVYKDLINLKYGSAYSSIGNTVNTCNESMGPFGLSARWEFPDSNDMNLITVTCILSHSLGHEEKVTLVGNPDKEGSKNPLQERKSARTYLKLETYEAVTGVASINGNVDDDGNSAGKAPTITTISDDQIKTLDARITDNDLESDIFTDWLAKKCPYTGGDTKKLSVDHYAMVLSRLDKTIKMKHDKEDQAE